MSPTTFIQFISICFNVHDHKNLYLSMPFLDYFFYILFSSDMDAVYFVQFESL